MTIVSDNLESLNLVIVNNKLPQTYKSHLKYESTHISNKQQQIIQEGSTFSTKKFAGR